MSWITEQSTLLFEVIEPVNWKSLLFELDHLLKRRSLSDIRHYILTSEIPPRVYRMKMHPLPPCVAYPPTCLER
jgi:hypothetical protein